MLPDLADDRTPVRTSPLTTCLIISSLMPRSEKGQPCTSGPIAAQLGSFDHELSDRLCITVGALPPTRGT